ncbi:MAG: protein-glutamate O-methyltransferase CheR [Oscillospiraceae bacterium]|nr:protein-glutamate O-methyltransferase CheR [Oscillospiraceae bacterium]
MDKIKRDEFMRVVTYMREQYGINLEQKQTLVEGRLWSVIQKHGFKSLDEYFEFVLADKTGEEGKILVTRLTTNYTYFMREDQHYKFLTDRILPALTPKLRDKDLRIWSAGCSSGEEPYTTVMVLDNYFGHAKSEWDCKVLATDISPQVLQMAQEAMYSEDKLKNLPPEWKKRYFNHVKGTDIFQVKPAIQNEVIFRSFNLMEKTFPFKRKFHVIFCRNVMIYFNKETRDALVERYYDALEPGGHLFIGLSETVSKTDTRFTFVQPSVYRKGGA